MLMRWQPRPKIGGFFAAIRPKIKLPQKLYMPMGKRLWKAF